MLKKFEQFISGVNQDSLDLNDKLNQWFENVITQSHGEEVAGYFKFQGFYFNFAYNNPINKVFADGSTDLIVMLLVDAEYDDDFDAIQPARYMQFLSKEEIDRLPEVCEGILTVLHQNQSDEDIEQVKEHQEKLELLKKLGQASILNQEN